MLPISAKTLPMRFSLQSIWQERRVQKLLPCMSSNRFVLMLARIEFPYITSRANARHPSFIDHEDRSREEFIYDDKPGNKTGGA